VHKDDTDFTSWGGGGIAWTPDPTRKEGSGGKNPAWKCLKHWNVAVGVDEG